MNPVNIERHLTCNNYANCDQKEVYKETYLQPRECTEVNSADKLLLVFVRSNDTRYSLCATSDDELNRNEVVAETRNAPFGLLLDKNYKLKIALEEGGLVQIFRFEHLSHLCSGYSFINLRQYAPITMVYKTIDVYEPLAMALDTIHRYVKDGLKCSEMMESKLKEVFFVLSGYYKPEVLGELLAPLLRREIDFKEFVIMNHFRVKSVQELADMRGMDLRKFNKLFKETFDQPPYSWMLEQKAHMIEERLADSTVSFNEIMEEFKFSSPSHFTVFCRRQFNKTPSQYRKELVREEAERRAAERRANHPTYYYK